MTIKKKQTLLEAKLRRMIREELDYSKYDDPNFDAFLDNVVKRFDSMSSSIRRALYRLRDGKSNIHGDEFYKFMKKYFDERGNDRSYSDDIIVQIIAYFTEDHKDYSKKYQ